MRVTWLRMNWRILMAIPGSRRSGNTPQLIWKPGAVVVSAEIEAELVTLPPEEQAEYLAGLGVSEGGAGNLIKEAYHLLGLRTYLTTGEKETRAWTIHAGDKAPAAAGVIHSDFEKTFISAETIAYEDLVACGGFARARELGKMRTEGKEYVVQDGDVMEFKTFA